MRLVRIYKRPSLSHSLIRGISLLVYWQLWKERCRRQFEGQRLHSSKVFHMIMNLCLQAYRVRPKAVDSPTGIALLHSLNVSPTRTPTVKVRWIRWITPIHGSLKLNTDGASKGNPGQSGGGAVLRNQWGQFVLSGSFYYGFCTNMEAELRELIDAWNYYCNLDWRFTKSLLKLIHRFW